MISVVLVIAALSRLLHIMQNCLCKYCKKELIYLTRMLIYEPINAVAGNAGGWVRMWVRQFEYWPGYC